jgi:2',3'-cyclic-nucleotide 2'-phosphodiesterase (5'-nucleotidase family)
MTGRRSLGIIQMNDSHAYMDIHQEMFWQGDRAVYHPAGGYAHIATLVNQIRAESQDRVLFCDCDDTLHGTYPALKTQGEV